MGGEGGRWRLKGLPPGEGGVCASPVPGAHLGRPMFRRAASSNTGGRAGAAGTCALLVRPMRRAGG